MTESFLSKYPLTVRLLHWVHSACFLLLGITGIMLAASPGSGSIVSLHNTIAHFFVALPFIFLVIRPRTSWRGLKMLFQWGRGDIAWLRAAPRYYLRNDSSGMPPQGFLNTGQKLWWLVTFLTWLLFSVSGLLKEVLVNHNLSPATVSAMTWVHDIASGLAGAFFLAHVILGLTHRESLRSIVSGKVSGTYARENHGKWYAEQTAKKS